MTIRKFQTNLNCGNCVAAVKPFLDNDPSIRRWSVDTTDARKVLSVEGDQVTAEQVTSHVARAGFKLLGVIEPMAPVVPTIEEKSFTATYWPVLLVFAYLFVLVTAVEFAAGRFDGMRAMANFMGGFFIAFSFFKLLDLRGFADAFQSYDIVARPVRAYGYVYPFIELSLGIAYIVHVAPVVTNVVTLIVMALGMIGVAQALVQKRKIRCACLGTVFKLPMSTVAFVEDALMGLMAFVMLIFQQV